MSTFLPLTAKWPWRTSSRACGREVRQPQAVDDVVEAPLEQLEEHLAGDPALPLGLLEVEAELVLEHAVDPLDALLLAQLQAVARQLRARRLPCCPGGKLRFSIAHFSV